jgi:hypothetical protein
MPQSVSDIIYDAFFKKLSLHKEVKTATVDSLRKLYEDNQFTNKQNLSQVVHEMESRYAKNKTTNS